MPSVPRYGQRKEVIAPLPGARLSAGETQTSAGVWAAEAEGQVGHAIGQFGQVIGHVASAQLALQEKERLKAKEQADQVAAMKYQTALSKWKLDTMYDPVTGVTVTRRGDDAMTLPEELSEAHEKRASELSAELLHTPEAQAMGEKIRAQSGLELYGDTTRYTFKEIQRVEQQTLDATVQTASQSAVAGALDPGRRVALEMGRGEVAIRSSGPRLGMSQAEVDLQVAKFQTVTHEGVITALLASGEVDKAGIYFRGGKDDAGVAFPGAREQMTVGDAAARVTKQLEVADVRGEAQKLSDSIINKGGTVTEQIDAVKAANPRSEVRDQAVSYIKQAHEVKKAQQGEDHEKLMDTVYTKIFDSKGQAQLLPSEIIALGKDISHVEAFAKAQRLEEPITTDWQTYYQLKNHAATNPTEFGAKGLSIMNYSDRLAPSQLKEMIDLQTDIRKGKPVPQLAGFSSNTQIFESTLREYALDPTPKEGTPQAKAVASVRRQLDERVEELQAGGKKITDKETRQILDHILSQKDTVPAWFGFSTKEKLLVEVAPENMPPDVRKDIEDALRASHLPVTDALIRDRYIKRKLKERAVAPKP
jgi:hypothetical protein